MTSFLALNLCSVWLEVLLLISRSNLRLLPPQCPSLRRCRFLRLTFITEWTVSWVSLINRYINVGPHLFSVWERGEGAYYNINDERYVAFLPICRHGRKKLADPATIWKSQERVRWTMAPILLIWSKKHSFICCFIVYVMVHCCFIYFYFIVNICVSFKKA